MSRYLVTFFAILPFGAALGLGLTFARVSGVDFRQWFQDAAQPREISDDTWIGFVRKATAAFAGAIALTVCLAWIAVWLPDELKAGFTHRQTAARWLGNLLALPLSPHVLGTLAGYALGQVMAEIVWRTGLGTLPKPATVKEVLSTNEAAGAVPEALDRPVAQKTPKRRLVLFCDGTWNWPDATRATNVVRLLRGVVAEADGVRQICYYHQGVGTGNILDRIVGGGAGVGISNSVKACYGFLADNYQDGDEILLFGFSRGAYVARSVAGMVGTVGVLRKGEMRDFAEVWDWFTDHPKKRDPNKLDEIASRRWKTVPIQCIGVWDTVGALGIPGSRLCARSFTFHDTGLGAYVRHAFQALALDEQRGNFQAAIWVPPEQAPKGQVVEQVWFPGVHSNIGGGYPARGLSDTTLIWMVSRLVAYDLLGLDEDCIRDGLDPDENYGSGRLEDSRSWAWALFGSAVPRPVGLISSTERIHASAWDRATAEPPVPQDDLYRRPARIDWLAAKQAAGLAVARDAKEIELRQPVATAPDTPARAPYKPKPLGLCDRLMQTFGGSG